MKKFVIISVVLLLLAGSAFGYALYHYVQVIHSVDKGAPAATEAVTEAIPEEEEDAAEGEETPADMDGIFAEYADKAAAFVEGLSTEEMVGQLVMGICADAATASSEMNKYSLAGMLFESDNFGEMTKEEIISALKNASSDSKIKPILAAQEEGGMYTTVSDLDAFPDYDFNAPRIEFATGGLKAVEKAEDSKATLLKSLGFNFNLAPVIDLADSSDQMMYSRSVSEKAETASAYAEYAAKFNQSKGISVALKHFPGYGTIPDSAYTGTDAVVDDRDAATIRDNDYAPFKAGVEAGAHCVVVSNVLVKKLDATHTAALSPSIHTELRDTVGFTGIIMTDVLDDLDYSAYADGNKPAVQAVLAGNDIVLVRDYATAYNDIFSAVKAGTITETQLKNACTRVIAYKYTAGIMQ